LVLGLYLSTHGLKRKGKKLLGPGVAAVIGVNEGGPTSTAALPGSGSALPGDGDCARERGERGECCDIGERMRESYCRPEVRSKGNGPHSNNCCGPNLG
jgi:hypothetical protein